MQQYKKIRFRRKVNKIVNLSLMMKPNNNLLMDMWAYGKKNKYKLILESFFPKAGPERFLCGKDACAHMTKQYTVALNSPKLKL